jgi:hypothetical protein
MSSQPKQQQQFVQWNDRCSIDQTNLTEYTIVEYISSLEWSTKEDVLDECNQLLVTYGRQLVTRSSGRAAKKLLLMCVHAGAPRVKKRQSTSAGSTEEDRLSSQDEDSTELVDEDVYADAVKHTELDNCSDSDLDNGMCDSNDESDDDQDEDKEPSLKQPAEHTQKKNRKTSSGKVGCEFGLRFGYKVRQCTDSASGDVKVYSAWRMTSCLSSNIQLNEANKETGHSLQCHPLYRLKHGGILYMHQLTQPMIDDILMMHKGTIKPCQIRTAVELEHKVKHIDFALIQNVINRDKPRKHQAEVDDLLDWLDKTPGVIHSCQWQDAKLDGRSVQEIRNVFWTNDVMIRMYYQYGQSLVVDATYRATHFDFKLLLFTVRTGNGKFSVVGFSLIQQESSEDVRWSFLELLKASSMKPSMLPSTEPKSVSSEPTPNFVTAERSPSLLNLHGLGQQIGSLTSSVLKSSSEPNSSPGSHQNDVNSLNSISSIDVSNRVTKTIMTDAAPAYPSIIAELFPGTDHQICVWHQEKLMLKFCKDRSSNPKLCAAAMTAILREENVNNAEVMWKNMIRDYFHDALARVRAPENENEKDRKKRKRENKIKQNAQRLIRHWYKVRRRYWRAYTKDYENLGAVSSQAGESMNHAIKRRNHVSLAELFLMSDRVVNNHIFEQMKAVEQSHRIPLREDPNYSSWNASLRLSLTLYSVGLLTEQLKLADRFAREFGLDGSNKERVVDLDSMTCSCGFVAQQGLMCRHLMIAWLVQHKSQQSNGLLTVDELFTDQLKNELAATCIKNASSRWRLDVALHVIGEESVEQSVEDCIETAMKSSGEPSDTNHREATGHHEIIDQKPEYALPGSKLMKTLELKTILARLENYASKDDIALDVVITKANELFEQLDGAYVHQSRALREKSKQRTSSQLSDSALPRSVQGVIISRPENAVDPLYQKTEKRHRDKSTAQAAQLAVQTTEPTKKRKTK